MNSQLRVRARYILNSKTPLKLGLAALCLATMAGVAHCQPARQGEDNVTHFFTVTDKSMKMGNRLVIQRELSGVSTNDSGSGMFHNLGVRCLSFVDIVDGKASSTGRCVDTDADGDQIFHTFENTAGVGAHTLIGGSGKFTGITGQQVFGAVRLIKGPDGGTSLIVPVKAKWKIQ